MKAGIFILCNGTLVEIGIHEIPCRFTLRPSLNMFFDLLLNEVKENLKSFHSEWESGERDEDGFGPWDEKGK